jgi:hypothetical protein
MRRILVAAVVVASLGGFVLAEEIPEDIPELEVFSWGGPLVGLLSFDFSPLNVALTAAGYPALDGHLVVFGGGSAGGVLGGIAFGGLGLGGSLTSLPADRRTDLEFGFSAGLVETTWRAGDRMFVGVGALLGWGSLDLTARARYPADFADALAEPTVSQFSLGFVGGVAYLRVQIQALDWLAFEGWFGYFLSFPGQWTEGGQEIAGPRLDLRAPFFGVGIVFGGVGPLGEPE